MARGTSQDFSSKRHHFHWTKKVGSDENDDVPPHPAISKPDKGQAEATKPNPKTKQVPYSSSSSSSSTPKKKPQSVAVSRLRSIIASLGRTRAGNQTGLGSRVVGTLFGSRRGHVHFALQKDPNSPPAFLVELATPISGLVREMASGLVRIALECDKDKDTDGEREKTRIPSSRRLIDEPVWRTYCNGKKCGFASRRECGVKEMKVLKAVEMVSMGAGVLPADKDSQDVDGSAAGDGAGSGGEEVMYMRAKFERIVGSRDSEAFYMMNPDNGAPELSIYLLRI